MEPADGLVWGVYSLVQQDISIMVNAFFQLTTSGLIVALKLAQKARIQKQGDVSQSFDSCKK